MASALRSRLSTSRRRKTGGGSSREASAESNGSASDFDDTDAASVQNLTLRDDPSSLPRQTKANVGLRQRVLSPADDATELETETGDDGDVSSAGRNRPRVNTETATQHPASHYNALPRPRVVQPHQSSSSSVTFGEGEGESGGSPHADREAEGEADMVPPSPPASAFTRPPGPPERKHSHAPAPSGLMSRVSAAELQESVREAISGRGGVDGVPRVYKINEPPTDRPVRIYCDGVYDLFHYAHALQLRQAKLSFPNVYLLAGVCADELVAAHKNIPVLKSEERYESVRNCKWVDEVVEDAPWTVTQDFIDKHRIDYIAHDEEPYQSAGSDDIYKFVKDQGKFLPTRRTSGISTSELLQRIVENYRLGDYDVKFDKIGHPELRSHPPSETGSRATRKSESAGAFDSPSRISSPTRPSPLEHHEHLGVPATDGVPSHLEV